MRVVILVVLSLSTGVACGSGEDWNLTTRFHATCTDTEGDDWTMVHLAGGGTSALGDAR